MRAVVAAVSLGMLLSSGPAGATGFMVARFGGEQGTPMANNPTVIYYNPAGLAFSTGTRVYVEGFFVYRTLGYDRPTDAIDHPNDSTGPGTPDPAANSGEARLKNFLVSPFLGVTSDLGVKNLGVGLAFYTPFGGQQNWGEVDRWKGNATYPGAVDGPQRWHDIEGEIRSSYVTAAGAYRLGNFSFGLGANLVMSVVNDLRAANADGRDDTNIDGTITAEGRAWLDVSDVTLSLGAGVQWQPIDQLTLGLSYQSQPGFGEMKYSGTLQKQLGAGNPDAPLDVDYRHALPDIIRLGAAYRPAKQLELRLWGSFERWSAFENMCILNAKIEGRKCDFDAKGIPQGTEAVVNNIPRHWKDAVAVRASASYYASDTLELQGGLGFDGDAVPDETMDVSLEDENDVQVAVGAVIGLLDNKLKVTASFFAVIGLGKSVDPRPRDAMGEKIVPFEGVSRIADGAGDYDVFVGVLQLGVEYKF